MESSKDDLKTQFVTREGCYRLLNLSEYSRPNRVGYQSNQNSPQVRVSFVSLPQTSSQVSGAAPSQPQQQHSVEKGMKILNKASVEPFTNLSSSGTSSTVNKTINGNNITSTSNGPVPASNSLSSSATTATVTSLTNGLQQENNYLNQNNLPNGDWICFNFGKELYTYSYRGVKKVSAMRVQICKH